MCGIVGIIGYNLIREQDLDTMAQSISHRGPDNQGIYIDGNVGLGHRRLSIIDLSSAAHQPMISSSSDTVIVFNGEIYNYLELRKELHDKSVQFRTSSDTEVILELYQVYGKEFVHKLRGMFAIAVYDRLEQKVFLYRDRLGIKPLYFANLVKGFYFASEIKAIASVIKEFTINLNGFYHYLRTSLFTEDDTIFSEVQQLKPGHYIEYSVPSHNMCITKYYDIYDIYLQPQFDNPEKYLIEKFSEKFNQVIKMHLNADVPVGTFLSGGLDSSIVTALSAEYSDGNSIYTASIIFPGEQQYYNEESFSDMVVNQYHTRHDKIIFKGDFLRKMKQLAWYADEPFGIVSSFALFYLSEEVSKHVKVVLTGDGADENLAGYLGLFQPFRSKYSQYQLLLRITAELVKPFTLFDSDFLKRNYLKLVDKSGGESYDFSNAATYSSTLNFELLQKEHFQNALNLWKKNNRKEYYSQLHNQSDLRKKLFSITKTRLIDEMLKKVDRMTMAHSLEARVPFLDHELVELIVRLPDNLKYKYQNGKLLNKYILRKTSEKHLNNEIIYREKHGFDMPFGKWIMDDNMIIKDVLLNGFLVRNNVIKTSNLEKLFNNHLSGKSNNMFAILTLYSFESWLNSYNDKIPQFRLSL